MRGKSEVSRKRSRVPHRRRGKIDHVPVHVTVRLREGLPSLRAREEYARVLESLRAFRGRFDCRVIAYSVLSNHVHLVLEPRNGHELARAVKGLLVRAARALNKLWRRAGSVWADRYHHRVVRKVHELRRLLRYVLNNARKHGVPLPAGRPDPYSSGPWFRSWIGHEGRTFSRAPSPVEVPQTMALGVAWRFLLGLDEVPGPRAWPPDSGFALVPGRA